MPSFEKSSVFATFAPDRRFCSRCFVPQTGPLGPYRLLLVLGMVVPVPLLKLLYGHAEEARRVPKAYALLH